MYMRWVQLFADDAMGDRFPYEFRRSFNCDTYWLMELYYSLLWRRLKTPDTVKVNVEFTDDASRAPHVTQALEIAHVRWLFDFGTYQRADDDTKKRMLLDGTHAALVWVASQRQWDVAILEALRDEVVKRNFTYEGFSKKTWLTPNKRFRARLGFRSGLRAVDFFVVLFDRKGREVARRLLVTKEPGFFLVLKVLKGKGEWTATGRFRWKLPQYLHPYLGRTWSVAMRDLIS